MTQSPSMESRVLRTICAILLIGSLVVGAVAGCLLIFQDWANDELVVRAIFTPVLGLLSGTAGLLCVQSMSKGRVLWLLRATIILIACTGLGWLYPLWSSGFNPDVHGDEQYLKIIVSLSLLTVAMVIASQLMVHRTDSPIVAFLRYAGVVMVAVYFPSSIQLLWTEWWEQYDSAVGVLFTLGGLVLFIHLVVTSTLIRLSKRKSVFSKRETISGTLTLRLNCPKCSQEQALPMGLRRCCRCGFAMLIEVQEPRCDCGYLLYQLQGDMCPECGRAVRTYAKLPTDNQGQEQGHPAAH